MTELQDLPPARWYQVHAHLSPSVAFFLWYGLTTSTQKTYSTGQQSFIDFISLHPHLLNPDGSYIPAIKPAILEWVAHLGYSKRILASTIKSYLGHVKSLHVDSDLPFDVVGSPVVQRVIHGIKQYFSDRDCRPTTPITLSILQRLVNASTPQVSLQHTTIDAAIKLAFAGFLHSGEFVVIKYMYCQL